MVRFEAINKASKNGVGLINANIEKGCSNYLCGSLFLCIINIWGLERFSKGVGLWLWV